MEYRIEVKKAFAMLAKAEEQLVNDVRIPAFWEKCKADGTLDELSCLSSHANRLHIGMADGSTYNGKSYTYYIGTPYVGEAVPSGYIIKDVPEREWAVFLCPNLDDQEVNREAFRWIYADFFPSTEFKPAQFQCEVWPQDGSVAEIWVAVRKKDI